jgi:hypothetical protein
MILAKGCQFNTSLILRKVETDLILIPEGNIKTSGHNINSPFIFQIIFTKISMSRFHMMHSRIYRNVMGKYANLRNGYALR